MNTPPTSDAIAPRPMDTAPKDGTIVRLLVKFTDGAFDDVEPGTATWTIGQNGDHHPEEDEWLFAGWNWEQDCFTQGEGEPIGWLPLHGELEPAREIAAQPGEMKQDAMGGAKHERCDDCPSGEFRIYNAATGTLVCAHCGQTKQLPSPLHVADALDGERK